VRAVNEDALLAYPPVFLVADGMGGHDAGDVASRLVVEEFAQLAGRTAVSADDVHACFERTAARIVEAFAGRAGGTTVAGVAVAEDADGSYWLVFNVGDSRVYRWANGVLTQISVDHSVVQELIDHGELDPELARTHPERHVLTRALTAASPPDPDYWLIPARPHDRILVCSDGLTRELTDDMISDVLGRCGDAQEAAQALVRLAIDAGGRDNVSTVVVDVATTVTGESDAHPTVPRPAAEPVPCGATDTWDETLDGATVPRALTTEATP
jgi:serine/threonine protein phosphatase PrpC